MLLCTSDLHNFLECTQLCAQQMQIKLSKQELEKWVVTVWATWKASNRFYFKQFQTHPKVILEGDSGLIEEYQRLMNEHSSECPQFKKCIQLCKFNVHNFVYRKYTKF